MRRVTLPEGARTFIRQNERSLQLLPSGKCVPAGVSIVVSETQNMVY